MKLDKVTITGADDSISVEKLAVISKEFPFVEWGILLSKSKIGSSRFPSGKWIDELSKIKQETNIKLSGHICGKWMVDIRSGIWSILEEVGDALFMFDRLQINFGSTISDMNTYSLLKSVQKIDHKFQYIFQLKNAHSKTIVDLFRHSDIDCVPLFDASGGTGELPAEWPEYPSYYCGYAGGLSPSNVELQLQKIERTVKDNTIWIDVESKVRSNNDILFDENKVRKFLTKTSSYVC